jgi:hydroxypyruvate isomerase
MTMDRRTFVAAGLAGVAGSLAHGHPDHEDPYPPDFPPGDPRRNDPVFNPMPDQEPRRSNAAATYTLDYAPHFGMFHHHAGEDMVDQIDFMAEAGFRSIEDNGMRSRSVEDQQRIADALQRHDMRMGVFVMNMDGAWRPSLTTGDAGERALFVQNAKDSVEVAKRVNANWMTVVPGMVAQGVDEDTQMANVVESLKQAANVLEEHDIVMVCEPLNWRDHNGLYLRFTPQSMEIMKRVDSPSCRILQDLYHQQATEGNLIDHMNAAWDYIPYFQVGDNPGRREPGTGEINYANVFKHMHERGFTGIVGMEHGKSIGGKKGEVALIEAYRTVDPA